MTVTDLKRYIYENDKIPLILEALGCEKVRYNGDRTMVLATQPDGDNPSGVCISNNTYLSYCSYSRNVPFSDRKDLISFIQEYKGLDFVGTLRYLHSLLGLQFSLAIPAKKPKTNKRDQILSVFKKHKARLKPSVNPEDIKALDEKEMTEYVPMIHIELFREGVIKRTIDKFGLMYSYKLHRTIFPMRYWADGTVIGLNGRTSIKNYEELGIRKYYISKGYPKSNNLYGLWENRADIEKAKQIVLFESEKSVLKRDSMLDATCVALSGHIMSEEQFRIILGLKIREVIVALDKDIDIYTVFAMCDRFYGLRNVSYILDTEGILKSKDSPADASNKDYMYLFNNRRVYGKNAHERFLKHIKR